MFSFKFPSINVNVIFLYVLLLQRISISPRLHKQVFAAAFFSGSETEFAKAVWALIPLKMLSFSHHAAICCCHQSVSNEVRA